jgi:hypothetical protein
LKKTSEGERIRKRSQKRNENDVEEENRGDYVVEQRQYDWTGSST